jgi:tetratricopeptide (TPR) repeat protein
MPAMRRAVGSVVVLLGLILCSQSYGAGEEAERSAKAKVLYEEGMAHFQLEEYNPAIEKWEAGFRVKPVPEFLYNIAQAHRLAKHYEKAQTFYQRYLRLAPRAANRPEVERTLATLPKLIEEEKNRPPEPAPPPPPAATPTPAPTPAVTPEPVHAEVTATQPAKKPVYKKGWFWGVVVGSVVVVGAAVALGVVFGTRSSGDSTPALPGERF